MTISEKNVIISRETWEELRRSAYYKELVEAVEDREALRKAKEEAEDFIEFREYDRQRSEKNVQNHTP